jgi:hypothetical protein
MAVEIRTLYSHQVPYGVSFVTGLNELTGSLFTVSTPIPKCSSAITLTPQARFKSLEYADE